MREYEQVSQNDNEMGVVHATNLLLVAREQYPGLSMRRSHSWTTLEVGTSWHVTFPSDVTKKSCLLSLDQAKGACDQLVTEDRSISHSRLPVLAFQTQARHELLAVAMYSPLGENLTAVSH